MAEPAGSVETAKDFGDPPAGIVGQWLVEIKAYDRAFENWVKRAEAVQKRYRNEQVTSGLDGIIPASKSFNILWSNIQTLQPSLYSRTPKADITRTHKDRDPAARAGAIILERATRQELKTGGFDDAMKAGRDDYLIAARGQIWNRYVPTYGDETRDQIFLQEAPRPDDAGDDYGPQYLTPDGGPIKPGTTVEFDDKDQPFIYDGEPYRPVVAECSKQEHIHWKDFGHTPAPSWGKVRAVWKREMLTRDQLVERFGKKKGEACALTRSVANVTSEELSDFGDAFKRAEVYEIWDKTSGKVIWISAGYTEGPLDIQDDPLHLDGFFPCPKPLYGTLTTDSLIPVTDYDEYVSQAEEIDTLTKRINLLTQAMKVAGIYAGEASAEIQKVLTSNENTLVPVDNWAAFAEKGGLPGLISWLPIKDIAGAIVALTNIRAQTIQDLYQISGLADIMRGSTDPNETFGAQRIKAQFGSMRLQDRQAAVAAFARDNVRITAEIIAEHFSPETLWEISGWQHSDEARALDRAEAEWLKQAQAFQQAQMQALAMGATPSGGALPAGSPASSISMPTMVSGPTPPPQAGSAPMPKPPEGEKPPNAREAFDAAVKLLRDDKLRGFSIDIETDSMVFEDQQLEQKNRIEFIQAISAFLQQAVPAGQAFPALAPILMELLMFGIRGFKTGRTLEAMFEQAAEQLGSGGSMPAQPQQGEGKAPADPRIEMGKLQVEMGKLSVAVQKLQLEKERGQIDAQLEAAKLRKDAMADTRAADNADQRLALDRSKAIADVALGAAQVHAAAQRPVAAGRN